MVKSRKSGRDYVNIIDLVCELYANEMVEITKQIGGWRLVMIQMEPEDAS